MRHLILAVALFGAVAHAEDGNVFTSDTAMEAYLHANEVWPAGPPWKLREPTDRISVKHVSMPNGPSYPDVVCLDFSGGSVCFDPMELTER